MTEDTYLERFVHALAMTESGNNTNAPLGDNGRAMGRFQVHPDWVFTFSSAYHLSPMLGETWDSFITRIVRAFYQEHVIKYGMTAEEIAMAFHIGHIVKADSSDWDVAYAERFHRYYQDV